jgi:hypothetical protein
MCRPVRELLRSMRILAIATLLCLAAHPAVCQDTITLLDTCGRTAPGLGSIAGTLIADSMGIQLERGVFVKEPVCAAVADSAGHYELSGLPPGTYTLTVGDLGVRRVAPVTVRVGPDSVTHVDIHLQPENLVLDCVADKACAALLTPLTPEARSAMDEEDQLLDIAVRTTIAISRFTEADSAPGALCVGVTTGGEARALPPAVFAEVRRQIPIVRNPSECRSVAHDRGGNLRTADGLWAWSYAVGRPSRAGDSATGESSYYVAALWAAGWHCEYHRTDAGWQARRCRLTGIS